MKSIWVPISGQIAQQRKVEAIANNIANANTTGFKKDDVTFKEHLTAFSGKNNDIHIPSKEFSPDDFYHTEGAENAFVKVDGSYTDFTQGNLKPTGNNLDFGLNGKGFFEVLTPQGIRYTRNGSFTLSKDGELVTSNGFKLLTKKAEGEEIAPEERILKLPTSERISVSKEGEIFNKTGLVANMSLVEFKDNHTLKKQGQGLFINNHPQNRLELAAKTTVNQGFIEGSNVNAIQEMSELIRAHRHFDNIQKAVNTYDAMAGRAMNDISKF